jgi:hypothetical protein
MAPKPDLEQLRKVLGEVVAKASDALLSSREEDLHAFADEVEALKGSWPELQCAFRSFLLQWQPFEAKGHEPGENQGESV